MPVPEDFFSSEQRISSFIKTEIVAKYFASWLRIMTNPSFNRTGNVGYVDLFAGPGKFVTDQGIEAPSTPIKILDFVEREPTLTSTLHLHFNDKDPEHIEALKHNLQNHPAWHQVYDRTYFSNESISPSSINSKRPLYPSLYFIDPFGYKGLSIHDFGEIIRGHGNDLLFFFNYNRFNMDLEHPNEKIVDAPRHFIGPEGLKELQALLARGGDRQEIITEYIWSRLESCNGTVNYVVPFEFKLKDKNRTSHYLVFVSKNRTGRKIIREVMAGLRDDREGGSFTFSPKKVPAGLFGGYFELGEELRSLFSGQELSVKEIIERHDRVHPRSPYIERDYKDVLKQLRGFDYISVRKPDGKSVPPHQMPDGALVRFL